MERLEQLDSMRGLAAVIVLVGHCLGVLPVFWKETYGMAEYGYINLLKHSPLNIIIAGHEAVMFFFTLSGFVLMLPFLAGRSNSYSTFVLRRFMRIYIPFYGAILLAIAMRLLITNPGSGSFSEWFHSQWTTPMSWQNIGQHLLLIGEFDTNRLDPVIWSLVHEMRISLLFPILALLVMRWSWKAIALMIPLISVTGYGVKYAIFHYPDVAGGGISLLGSVQFVPMFLAGALLAKHREAVVRYWKRISMPMKIAFAAAGWLAFTYSSTFFPNVSVLHKSFMDEFTAMTGALVGITCAISSSAFRKFLLWRPIHYIGQISYSLYLFHNIVLIVVLWTLSSVLPLPLLLGIVVLLSVAIAGLSYRYVELPAMRWGKSLSGRLRMKKQAPRLERAG